jgi:hypothetical protein
MYYNQWKRIGTDEKGFREYRISIPKSDFTTSLEPSKNKILLLNVKNKLHRKLLRKFYTKDEDWGFFGREEFLEYIRKKGYNGVDFHYISRNRFLHNIEDELVIFDLTKYLKSLELVYLVANLTKNPLKINKKN